jgi:hypothetical protein
MSVFDKDLVGVCLNKLNSEVAVVMGKSLFNSRTNAELHPAFHRVAS